MMKRRRGGQGVRKKVAGYVTSLLPLQGLSAQPCCRQLGSAATSETDVFHWRRPGVSGETFATG